MIKKIDHIAIAVKDLDEEIKRYKEILGFEFLGTEVVQEQMVKVAFFRIGELKIELTAPISDESPISNFLKKRGSGIHHLAYEVDDIEKEIENFLAKDIKMLNLAPKKGAHNARIAFAHPKSFSGVLVELKESGENS
jgi:methylmalonyl-CoA/ethylmalonyl-CoA epimerase